MQLINYQTDIPEVNIAIDEYLLLKAEYGNIGETLRFWESKEYFVVVGRSGKTERECFKDKCIKKNIKIIRRISGGGTVLQGAGCLNYSLILSYDGAKKLKEINSSYDHILGLISTAFKEKDTLVQYLPISDMVYGNNKFSGNAQARKKKFFLHHGTILYDFDCSKISEYIQYPPKEPEYRASREHAEFVVNLKLSRNSIEEVIKKAFLNDYSYYDSTDEDKKAIACLIDEKYSKDSWNHAF